MTPEQSWDVISVVLFLIYVFALTPFLGALLGGDYSSYGEDDRYSNCMCRGIIVQVVIGILYVIGLALINI